MESPNNPCRAAIKAAFLVVFLVAAIAIVRFTPVREHLTVERLGLFVDTAGLWAPLAYIAVYTVGVCLFVPATLLTAVGAAVFGPTFGFIYVWLGAMLGSSLAFFIGRYLGREFAASLAGDRLKKYDEAIAQNGFATVLYLRLVYFPFSPMNFGMGLTRVSFRDYFCATALGISLATFIVTFFIGTIKEVWASGAWEQLLSWQILFALGLLIFSFFIPKIIEKIKLSRELKKASGHNAPRSCG